MIKYLLLVTLLTSCAPSPIDILIAENARKIQELKINIALEKIELEELKKKLAQKEKDLKK